MTGQLWGPTNMAVWLRRWCKPRYRYVDNIGGWLLVSHDPTVNMQLPLVLWLKR